MLLLTMHRNVLNMAFEKPGIRINFIVAFHTCANRNKESVRGIRPSLFQNFKISCWRTRSPKRGRLFRYENKILFNGFCTDQIDALPSTAKVGNAWCCTWRFWMQHPPTFFVIVGIHSRGRSLMLNERLHLRWCATHISNYLFSLFLFCNVENTVSSRFHMLSSE